MKRFEKLALGALVLTGAVTAVAAPPRPARSGIGAPVAYAAGPVCDPYSAYYNPYYCGYSPAYVDGPAIGFGIGGGWHGGYHGAALADSTVTGSTAAASTAVANANHPW